MIRIWCVLLGSSVVTAGVLAQEPAGPVAVYPPSVEITHPRHPHAIQVLGMTADGISLDLRSKAKFTSADPKVAIVEMGWIKPIANGQTKVTVEAAGQAKTVEVKVNLPKVEPPYSFRHEVMAVLTRAGCNMGACHGYSLGKNGFKLSLRGADPSLDYFAITKDSFGRRVIPLSAQSSAMVSKPVGTAPHEGGVRFAQGSLSHEIMTKWIEQGCPSDLDDSAQVVGVRLEPDKLVLKPGQKHHLQLIATYTDGRTRDVTRLANYSANNTQYAEVGDEGLVVAGAPGETAIVGRFERTFAATNVMVLSPTAAQITTAVPQDHLIDKHVVTKLNRLRIDPSPIAGDEEFLRRVYLDLIGVQPKPDEVRAFLADKDGKKREKIIDQLFQRPEFVDHWSLKWGDLLQNSRTTVSAPSVYLFREFIRGAVASNMPLDQFAREILTARGGIQDDPAGVYFAISKDTNDTVERVTQVFCGVRMLCARCHAHPAENWTQADYYGLASFFSQVGTRQDARLASVPNTKVIQLNLTAGPATNPRTGQPQPAKFLGGDQPKFEAKDDRRVAYARWLTSPRNPFFARGMVNRVWSYFFHRGIIEPVDDIRSTNPPINPELLDALTRDFIESKFDARHLMRRIATSATYQRSSTPTAANRYDEQNFSHCIPRRIPAESLLDSLVQATGVAENFGGVPAGFRAAQLPDGNVENSFLRLFGKPQRMDACECERDNGSNMLQALHFINGKSILNRVQAPNARPAQILGKKLGDREQVEELYLWSIARRPNVEEMRIALNFLKANGERRAEALQDLMWALLNCRDFLLAH